ncbi:hypothetical protein Tco_0339340 [Tanacetum coccineum]
MQSQRWTDINVGIQQHLQKFYNTNKASLKAAHWIEMPRLPFGMIPGTKPEPLKIAKTEQRARSYAGRDPGHLVAFEIRCESGGCEDDEIADDEDGDEDEEDGDS